MHFPLLQDIIILLSFSVVVVFVLHRLKIPSILGFLLTGIMIGPYAFSLVTAIDQVELLSEIGVILLLFVIGMELSIKSLMAIKRTVFIGGGLQVFITILVTSLLYYIFNRDWSESIFVGFLFSLSSTAIVLTVLQNRDELSLAHGRNALGILIFQDIIVVPMMLVAPIMAGQSANVLMSVLALIFKSTVVILITIVSAKYLVPRLMHNIALTRNKELFLLTTISICFLVAYLTSLAGLSLALGAFLAGLIISESEYSHQATSIILPFRELFLSFFFISVGMLLDLRFFVDHIFSILGLLVFVGILKFLLVSYAVYLLKYSAKTVLMTALSLFQVGEFAFILSKVGVKEGLISELSNQYFLAVSVLSMLITPFVMLYSDQISDRILSNRLFKKMLKSDKSITTEKIVVNSDLTDHLIIIGFGINGSNLAKAARFGNVPYIIVEYDPSIVKKSKAQGEPIIYGDAQEPHILETVGISHANAIVVAISDAEATKVIVSNIRALSQTVYLIVRTRYVKEINELKALGADDVIPEEFETSVEIFSRVLNHFLLPINVIDHFTRDLRANNYDLFQSSRDSVRVSRPMEKHDFKVYCARVENDSGEVIGRKIRDSHIRENIGINILAIGRNGEIDYDIKGEEEILQHDLIFFHGEPDSVRRFQESVS